jgi:hypothetical protein
VLGKVTNPELTCPAVIKMGGSTCVLGTLALETIFWTSKQSAGTNWVANSSIVTKATTIVIGHNHQLDDGLVNLSESTASLVVSEPGSLFLLGTGLMGMAVFIRRYSADLRTFNSSESVDQVANRNSGISGESWLDRERQPSQG